MIPLSTNKVQRLEESRTYSVVDAMETCLILKGACCALLLVADQTARGRGRWDSDQQ